MRRETRGQGLSGNVRGSFKVNQTEGSRNPSGDPHDTEYFSLMVLPSNITLSATSTTTVMEGSGATANAVPSVPTESSTATGDSASTEQISTLATISVSISIISSSSTQSTYT